mgnify:CR=1 FL=1
MINMLKEKFNTRTAEDEWVGEEERRSTRLKDSHY